VLENKGFGYKEIAGTYNFNYIPNVASLIKDIKLLSRDGDRFSTTYVVGGLSTKQGGHSYVVNVLYDDGKFYAIAFDSVANLYPAFINEIGDTFEKIIMNADIFQHSAIGCRGYSLDVFGILERQDDYFGYLCNKMFNDDKKNINEYRKDLFDHVIKEKTNIVYLEKLLQSKKDDIENKIDTGFKTKEEIKFLEKQIIENTNKLNEYIESEIKKEGFDIKKFITNNKNDVTKFTSQNIIDVIWFNSKNIFFIDKYHPEMTHLMEDYKTLRKHILNYKDDEDSMLIIKNEIKRAIKYKCFKNEGKDVKNDSNVDTIIQDIINNEKSKYCFSGYKRREMNHIVGSFGEFLNSFVSKITRYNKNSHTETTHNII
jgi:hypothetical protein